MRENRPSQTASMVAFLRALGELGLTSAQGFHDPTARQLLPWPWSWMFQGIERRSGRLAAEPRRRIQRGVDLLALRTLIIDAHVREAVAQGARQLVILGAGLDGRAYRMDELAGVDVFEVDHPATQAYKRRRVETLASKARSLTFVPVNFERDSLDQALAAAGHRAAERTVWTWEGVVMYLTEEAFRQTLKVIAARSGPASTLVMNYSPSEAHAPAMRALFKLWGEPHIGARSPEQISAALATAGLYRVHDSGTEDWARRFHASPPDSPWARNVRVAVASVTRPSAA